MSLRQSCENCLFKQIHHQADITLSDFWGIESIMPDLNDDMGTSIIMIHSKKGKELFDSITSRVYKKEVNFDSYILFNPSMVKAPGYNYLRKRFIKECNSLSFESAYKKYCGNDYISKFRRKKAILIRKIKALL